MRKGKELRLHRLTLRLPGRVFEALQLKAEEDSRYVSDWIVVTLERAVAQQDPRVPMVRQRRRDGSLAKRLTLRIPLSLHAKLLAVAEADDMPIAEWVTLVLERAAKKTKS